MPTHQNVLIIEAIGTLALTLPSDVLGVVQVPQPRVALGSPSTTVSMSSVNISSNQFRECLLNSDTNELNPTDAFILKMRRMWSYRSQAVGVTRPYNY